MANVSYKVEAISLTSGSARADTEGILNKLAVDGWVLERTEAVTLAGFSQMWLFLRKPESSGGVGI